LFFDNLVGAQNIVAITQRHDSIAWVSTQERGRVVKSVTEENAFLFERVTENKSGERRITNSVDGLVGPRSAESSNKESSEMVVR
jgi:hypothetical protein